MTSVEGASGVRVWALVSAPVIFPRTLALLRTASYDLCRGGSITPPPSLCFRSGSSGRPLGPESGKHWGTNAGGASGTTQPPRAMGTMRILEANRKAGDGEFQAKLENTKNRTRHASRQERRLYCYRGRQQFIDLSRFDSPGQVGAHRTHEWHFSIAIRYGGPSDD